MSDGQKGAQAMLQNSTASKEIRQKIAKVCIENPPKSVFALIPTKVSLFYSNCHDSVTKINTKCPDFITRINENCLDFITKYR